MGEVTAYAAAGAVVQALHGQALGGNGLLELARTGDVTEAIEYLQQSAYGAVFPRSSIQRLLRPLEHRLKQIVITDAMKISRFAPVKMNPVVRAFVRRFEVANIKTVLGAILSKGAVPDLKYWMFRLGRYAAVNMDLCMHCHTLDEVLRVLAESGYRKIVDDTRLEYEKTKSLFSLEHHLDREQYGWLWDAACNAFGHHSPVTRLIELEIDIRNLQWAARLRMNFGMSSERTDQLLIARGTYSQERSRQRLASVDDLGDVVDAMPAWKSRGSLSDWHISVTQFSEQLERHLFWQAARILRRRPFSPEAVIAHLYWRQFEVHDITTIVESKRYRLELDVVRPLLCTLVSEGEAV